MIADPILRLRFSAGRPHFSNALELDGWVISGVRTLSLPRRSWSRSFQGTGQISG
jgi:hypothetical protein